MKVLYLGYAISREEASSLYGASVAGNKMQLSVLKQLSQNKDINLKSITIYPTAAFPRGKLFIKRQRVCLFKGFTSLKIGFFNLVMIKQLLETVLTYFEAKRIVKQEGIQIIVTFNAFPQVGLPAKWLKKKFGCEIVSLLADLPIDDTEDRKGVSALLRKCFDQLTRNSILCYDKIIALNKYAVQLYAPNTPYIIMEGGVDSKEITDITVKEEKGEKHIVYAGALVDYSGIINLVKAMKYVKDKSVILDIYGSGRIEEYIKRYTQRLPNVKYHGKVAHHFMKRIQGEAYLLVNPRPVSHPISKVTFPSKLFEYMISGTPVLTTKLNGLTKDYLDHMFIIDQNDPKRLGEKINDIVSLPVEELNTMASAARKFVLEHKSWEKQCDKIYCFLKEGHNETTNSSANRI